MEENLIYIYGQTGFYYSNHTYMDDDEDFKFAIIGGDLQYIRTHLDTFSFTHGLFIHWLNHEDIVSISEPTIEFMILHSKRLRDLIQPKTTNNLAPILNRCLDRYDQLILTMIRFLKQFPNEHLVVHHIFRDRILEEIPRTSVHNESDLLLLNNTSLVISKYRTLL